MNFTLIFAQAQAAAVYDATKGASRGSIYVSPFVGRLDDKGVNGLDLIKNCVKMFESSDHHVQVLAASVRSVNQLIECIHAEADIVTVPFAVLKQWGQEGMPINFTFSPHEERKPIAYQELDLNQKWYGYDITHELTENGIERFANDWNQLLK